ncbi:hypothetical protein [uncultured Devosia sp.]|uniref:hypothetical protein n=1 Tax=uncultured Devosia sp. TaxID=211434 RepID=UPI0035CC683B
MSTSLASAAIAARTPSVPGSHTLSAGLLAGQFTLLWATFFILSSAVGWPASLDDPASIALPRVLDNLGAIQLGYSAYLLAALLLVPASAALVVRLKLSRAAATLLIGLAVLSAIAKTIGITRWLFAMPVLAEAFMTPGADQGQISVVFDMLNAWAGGIGEIVGVGLLGGLWTIVAGSAVLATREKFSNVIGWFAIVAGAALFLTIPGGYGIDMGPALTASNIVWQFSLLAMAIWASRRQHAA